MSPTEAAARRGSRWPARTRHHPDLVPAGEEVLDHHARPGGVAHALPHHAVQDPHPRPRSTDRGRILEDPPRNQGRAARRAKTKRSGWTRPTPMPGGIGVDKDAGARQGLAGGRAADFLGGLLEVARLRNGPVAAVVRLGLRPGPAALIEHQRRLPLRLVSRKRTGQRSLAHSRIAPGGLARDVRGVEHGLDEEATRRVGRGREARLQRRDLHLEAPGGAVEPVLGEARQRPGVLLEEGPGEGRRATSARPPVHGASREVHDR